MEVYYHVDQQEDSSKKQHLVKRARTETDSYTVLLRIKPSIVEKCFGISLHSFLRCLDEEQAQYKPFSHCQYHAGVSFEVGTHITDVFARGELLTHLFVEQISLGKCVREHTFPGGAHITVTPYWNCVTTPATKPTIKVSIAFSLLSLNH